MNSKSILVLLLSSLYVGTCHYWYCCKVQAACYGCGSQVDSPIGSTSSIGLEKGTLVFSWSNNTAIVKEGFGKEKAEWLSEKSEDNLLEITGEYFEGETAPEGYSNMGLARADAIRKLLVTDLPDERMRLRSKIVPSREGVKNSPFISIKTKWVPIKPEGSEVINFGKKAIILFPTGSYRKETDKEIDQFLETVAKRVKQSGEIILLTGHTDKKGAFSYNQKLGLKRAMRIRRILRQKGVGRDQIVAFSKGEQEPIASNATDLGRYQNRRVVLEIRPLND